jgi:hypothetical protein
MVWEDAPIEMFLGFRVERPVDCGSYKVRMLARGSGHRATDNGALQRVFLTSQQLVAARGLVGGDDLGVRSCFKDQDFVLSRLGEAVCKNQAGGSPLLSVSSIRRSVVPLPRYTPPQMMKSYSSWTGCLSRPLSVLPTTPVAKPMRSAFQRFFPTGMAGN